jgi:hypothetical protein
MTDERKINNSHVCVRSCVTVVVQESCFNWIIKVGAVETKDGRAGNHSADWTVGPAVTFWCTLCNRVGAFQ